VINILNFLFAGHRTYWGNVLMHTNYVLWGRRLR